MVPNGKGPVHMEGRSTHEQVHGSDGAFDGGGHEEDALGPFLSAVHTQEEIEHQGMCGPPQKYPKDASLPAGFYKGRF